jgi:hypothetical protein
MSNQTPDGLAKLPVCPKRGLPIPYANLIGPDGQPDFAVLDSRRVDEIATRRLRGICSRPLAYWMVFLGGPSCASSRCYLDPPMHEECARAALQMCPYLNRQDMGRRRATTAGAVTPAGFTEDKPERYLLYVTRSYKHRVTPDGVVFLPAPAIRIERCVYVEGRLTESLAAVSPTGTSETGDAPAGIGDDRSCERKPLR